MLGFYSKCSWYQRLFFIVLGFFSMGFANLAAQQQNPDEIPAVGSDYGSDFGNDTNYGLSPNNQSFDQQTSQIDYPSPEEIKRNTISTSLVGLAQGFLYMEWEHLFGRRFGIVLGISFYASEIGQTRRLFKPAALDNNSFANIGGMLGFTFYTSQLYAQGLAIQIKVGGGLLTGTYTESGQTEALNMFDIYASAIWVIAYRINVTTNVALSPLLIINGNVILPSAIPYNEPNNVPSYYRINGHSDFLSLSAPAELTAGLRLFMHVGLGFDLTFTF